MDDRQVHRRSKYVALIPVSIFPFQLAELSFTAGWWAMFALRAHQAYPNQTWFDLVQNIEYNNTAYWDDTCGGGVLWLTYRPMIKNTITNGSVPSDSQAAPSRRTKGDGP